MRVTLQGTLLARTRQQRSVTGFSSRLRVFVSFVIVAVGSSHA